MRNEPWIHTQGSYEIATSSRDARSHQGEMSDSEKRVKKNTTFPPQNV